MITIEEAHRIFLNVQAAQQTILVLLREKCANVIFPPGG